MKLMPYAEARRYRTATSLLLEAVNAVSTFAWSRIEHDKAESPKPRRSRPRRPNHRKHGGMAA